MSVCICACVCRGEVSERNREGFSHATMYMWNSEDNLLASVLSFLVGVREQNLLFRCGYKRALWFETNMKYYIIAELVTKSAWRASMRT